ncbi:type VI secretion system Vgr family protein [Pseudoduganella plicata]|uniref:Type VI secretion system tip protein VgrG n=1 Tax=Pseudoduganella plicata TaxID=321984 RepID=A0A4P7BHL5_9BURK|nr:type VI secretion system Vgr family protein [Pseudoduganella plicata]QBQ37763.1 type VI secretion system tip protein VgrG [Pseudoduganella plicata]GGY92926.1 hypothetical protein GCM10007388_27920 [Pseudoduganella plicata]
MNLHDTFINLLVDHRDLLTDNRPVRLRVDHPNMFMEDVLLPQRVQGSESICGGFEYRVLCVALNACLPLKEFIALPAAIDFVTDTGKLRTVTGIITEVASGDSDGGLASYQIVIRDALAVMDKRVNTRVFRNKNEIEIVQILVQEWQQTSPVLATQFRLEIDWLMKPAKYPAREFTMQYNESDAAFIRRLLKRRGICWHFGPDDTKNYLAHRLVLWDHFESVLPNAADMVRYHRDAATEERDTITSWNAVRMLQVGSVSRHSWNYKDPYGPFLMSMNIESRVTQCNALGDIGVALNDYQVLMPHAGDNHDDLIALGTLAMKRHDLETKCFQGEGSVRDFRAGESFKLTGHPEIDRHPREEREFVITELHVAAQNNLPKELANRVEKLFRRSRWHSADMDDLTDSGQRSRIRFTAIRKGIDIVPAFDARTDLPRVHMQTAMVVGPENEEVHCDELYRVRIRIPGTREADHAHSDGRNGASGTDRDSAWVRVATNWAGEGPHSGKQCGTVSLPRVGSEVLLAFLGGDPDKPVIVGQLYNQKGQPPALSTAGGLPGNRHLSGIRTKEVKQGGRGNQLRFDDTNGQISAQLASDHGESQLNLGFLTQPRKAGYAEVRGQGAELRSDQKVAVRGEAGLLLTAEINGGPEGKQLERAELSRLAAGIEKLSGQLAKLAERYAQDEPMGGELKALVEGLKQLDEAGSRMVALSGPDGIVATSGQALALGAATDIDLVSSEQMRLSAAGSTAVRAAKGVSVFTNQGGVKVTAAGGKVQVQAQNDALELLARKVLDIISTTDWINIKAKQGVRINGGGSELVLSADGIKGYTSGKSEMHAADHQTMKGQAKKATFPGADACELQAKGAAESGAAVVPLKRGKHGT